MSIYGQKWIGVLALLLAGCATFGRRGPVPEEVATCRELSRQGVAAMEMGQWPQAETLLRKAIAASPADATTRQHLAEALWRRGATQEALVQMEAAIRLNDSDASMTVRAGEMLLATGSTEKALERAEQAIGLDPKLAAAWALRGRVRWHQNQMDRALADLQRAIQFAPDQADLLFDVATLYRQRGQHSRCLTTLHHLLDTYSPGEEPSTTLQLEGLTLLELGRPREAAQSLLAASERGEPSADLLLQLAQAERAAESKAKSPESRAKGSFRL